MLNLVWYQFKLKKYQENRVQVQVWVAPGWSPEVQRRLAGMGIVSRRYTTNRLDIRQPGSVALFLRALGPSAAMEAALARYEAAVAQDVRGKVRPPDLQEEQEAAARGLFALFVPPPASPCSRYDGVGSLNVQDGSAREPWRALL
jgi:hypothetical protein